MIIIIMQQESRIHRFYPCRSEDHACKLNECTVVLKRALFIIFCAFSLFNFPIDELYRGKAIIITIAIAKINKNLE